MLNQQGVQAMQAMTTGRIAGLTLALYGAAGLFSLAMDYFDYAANVELRQIPFLEFAIPAAWFIVALVSGAAIIAVRETALHLARRTIAAMAAAIGGLVWWSLPTDFHSSTISELNRMGEPFGYAGLACLASVAFAGLWRIADRRNATIDLILAASSLAATAILIFDAIPIMTPCEPVSPSAGFTISCENIVPSPSGMIFIVGALLVIFANAMSLAFSGLQTGGGPSKTVGGPVEQG
jgi:hypothetical protein